MIRVFSLVLSLTLATAFSLAPTPPAGGYVLVAGSTGTWGTLAAGDTVSASGRGFVPGAAYRIILSGASTTDLAEVVATSTGTFTVSLTIPDNVAPGRFSVIACTVTGRVGCSAAATATVDVIAAATTTTSTTTTTTTSTTAPPTTTTTLPVTGSTPTTSPTTTTTLGVAIETTTTTFGFGIPSTTLGGDPPAPPSTFPLGVTTTTSLPDDFSGGDIPDIANLTLNDIEVTQGLQDLKNRFPLVEGRRTYVRLFATTESNQEQTGVMAALEGVRDGESLGIIFAENAPVHVTDTLIRVSHDYSPYFRLPDDWAEGSLTLRGWIWVNDPGANNEPVQADNLEAVTVDFHDARPVHLYLYPLYLTEEFDPNGDPQIYQAEQGWFEQTMAVLRLLPLDNLQVHFPSQVLGDAGSNWDLSEEGDPGAPLLALLEAHEASGLGNNHHFVGMVDPALAEFMKFGGFGKGLGEPVVWARMHEGFGQEVPWFQRGGTIIAHELGHNMGISHAPCLVVFGDPVPGEAVGGATDPLFPQAYGWPDCSLAPTDLEGFYGFDVYWEMTALGYPAVMSNNGSMEHPAVAYPFMGYRAPGWLDPWHGCSVLDFLDVPCDHGDLILIQDDVPGQGQGVPPTGSGGHTPFNCQLMESPFGGDDFCNYAPDMPYDPIEAEEAELDVVISGTVNATAGTGELVPIFAYPERRPVEAALAGDDVDNGPYLVVLRDAAGELLIATSLDLEKEAGHGADITGSEVFVVRLPLITGTASVELISPAGVLARIGPSSTPPVVEQVSVEVGETDLGITWTATDADDDVLVAQVQYQSGPDGEWIPIGHRVTSGRLAVNAGTLPGGEAAAVRVLVSDGFHTTVGISESFALTDRAPQALIFEPLDGQTRPAGRAVDFNGQGLDPEDGFLEGETVEWSSDRDGVLGTGTALSVLNLSEGTHVITFSVTDSVGQTAVAETTVVVSPTDLPEPTVIDTVRLALAGELPPAAAATSSTTIAEAAAAPATTAGLGAVVGGAVGLVALVTAALLWRRRRTQT